MLPPAGSGAEFGGQAVIQPLQGKAGLSQGLAHAGGCRADGHLAALHLDAERPGAGNLHAKIAVEGRVRRQGEAVAGAQPPTIRPEGLAQGLGGGIKAGFHAVLGHIDGERRAVLQVKPVGARQRLERVDRPAVGQQAVARVEGQIDPR